MAPKDELLDREEFALGFLRVVPETIARDLVSDPSFGVEVQQGISRLITFQKGVHFRQKDFFERIRTALDAPGESVLIEATNKDEYTILSSEDGQVTCRGAGGEFVLPESRVFSTDSELRLKGLSAIAKDRIPKAIYDKWLETVSCAPFSDAEIMELHFQCGNTPASTIESVELFDRSGEVGISDLLPADPYYSVGLLGDNDAAQNLTQYADEGVALLMSSLSNLSELEQAKRAFVVCGHASITKKIPVDLKNKNLAVELLNWAESISAPSIKVAVAEFYLPSIGEIPELEEDLVRLLSSIISQNPASDNKGPYTTFAGLLIGLDGYVAQSRLWAERSIFFRRLLVYSQSTLLQAFPNIDEASLSGLSTELSTRFAPYSMLRTALDMRVTPRWSANDFDPIRLYADHVGRLLGAFPPPDELRKAPALTKFLGSKDTISAVFGVDWPEFARCGYLEGDSSGLAHLPNEVIEAIDEQLALDPPSVRSIVALVNAAPIFLISGDQAEKLVQVLKAMPLYFDDIETRQEVFAALFGLACYAAISKSGAVVDAFGPIARRYSKDVKSALDASSLFRILVMASCGFQDSDEGREWLSRQADFLAFSDMSDVDASNLLDDVLVLCQVQPELHGALSKSLAALKWLGSTRKW